MSGRRAHLVGSLPGADARTAMSAALDRLGPRLASLPDGETGARRNWIIPIIEGFRRHPDLELAKDGDWSDYDKTPQFRIRKGHKLYGASIDLGHVAEVEANWPVFEELRSAAGLPSLSYLSGVPGDVDLAMFTLGPAGVLRHRRPFTEATLTEIRTIHRRTEGQAVFQIELPVELVLLAKAPPPARPALARVLGGRVAELAKGSEEGTRFGLHLCLGDMNHRAFGRMTDASPLVLLSNAILRAWPAGRPLEFVHAPFAAADEPPPDDQAFYAPLAELKLPRATRFIAGIAHEGQDLAAQHRIRSWIDGHLGYPVDISTSCGLGRRDDAAATAAMDRIAELCSD